MTSRDRRRSWSLLDDSCSGRVWFLIMAGRLVRRLVRRRDVPLVAKCRCVQFFTIASGQASHRCRNESRPRYCLRTTSCTRCPHRSARPTTSARTGTQRRCGSTCASDRRASHPWMQSTTTVTAPSSQDCDTKTHRGGFLFHGRSLRFDGRRVWGDSGPDRRPRNTRRDDCQELRRPRNASMTGDEYTASHETGAAAPASPYCRTSRAGAYVPNNRSQTIRMPPSLTAPRDNSTS